MLTHINIFRFSAVVMLIAISHYSQAQCSINSSNGWNVDVQVTPTGVTASTTSCPWSYHYEVNFDYTVTFSGSATSRSMSGNLYFNCTGGSGGNPYTFLGTFTANSSGSGVTNNNARGYSSVSMNNYGANPHCTAITLDDVACGSSTLNYWGSGIGGSCSMSALPIKMLSFEAKKNNDGNVVLRWTTLQEINNDYFTVERSTDGVSWEALYTVNGGGNTDHLVTYDSLDLNPEFGNNYYRIKQTDYDGSFAYSAIKEVSIEDYSFQIFPNPASDFITITTNNESLNFSIIDAVGIRTPLTGDLSSGYDISHLQNGVYIIEASSGDTVIREKLVVSK